MLPQEEPPPSSAVAGAAPTAVERARSELHEKRQAKFREQLERELAQVLHTTVLLGGVVVRV